MSELLKIGTLVQCKRAENRLCWPFEDAIRTIRAVDAFYSNFHGIPCYHLDPPTTHNGVELSWARHHLRVIDNPKDAETDETLTWLPVPTTDEVAA